MIKLARNIPASYMHVDYRQMWHKIQINTYSVFLERQKKERPNAPEFKQITIKQTGSVLDPDNTIIF